MNRILLLCVLLAQAFLAPPGGAQEKVNEDERFATLIAEIDALKAQVEALKAENAALREKLAAAEKPKRDTPQTRRSAPTTAPYELGATTSLGSYFFATPAGWTAMPLKDVKLAAMYRSPDKSGVIRVQIRPNSAVAPDAKEKFAPVVIQKFKQELLKDKTELVEPPVVQNDTRFFLRFREVIKVNTDKTAIQTHLYVMRGKDMIELSVLTTSDAAEQIAATQKLAEDLLLSFKAGK